MQLEQKLARATCETHPDDAAVALEGLPPGEISAFLSSIQPGVAARIVEKLTAQLAARVLEGMPPGEAAAILGPLHSDVSSGILRRVESGPREALIGALPAAEARSLRTRLAYPEGTAGALADPHVLSLPGDMSAREALRAVRTNPSTAYHNLHVLDRDDVLVGVINLRDLILARPGARLETLIAQPPVAVRDDADRHEIAAHPAWREYRSLPVVDDAGRFLGALRYHTLRTIEQDLRGPVGDGQTSTSDALADLFRTALVGLAEVVVPPPSTLAEASTGRTDHGA